MAQEIIIDHRGKRYTLIGGRWHVWAAPRGASRHTEYRWAAIPHTSYKLNAELVAKLSEAKKAAA